MLCCLSCMEADLGDAPFYCNNGNPPCPEGYSCEKVSGSNVCVRNGVTYNRPDSGVDKTNVQADLAADSTQILDVPITTQDQHIPPDGPPASDKYPWIPDQVVKKDAPFHLGCKDNKECKKKDPQYPCCCPSIPAIPPLPAIWACLPICLNPLCLGI